MANVFAVGYTMDTLYFSWLETPVDVDVGLQMPQFTLEEAILYDCSQNYTAGQWLNFLLAFHNIASTSNLSKAHETRESL